MSSGHQTTLVHDHQPTEDFFAYHLARARGGAGMVVLEAHAVDESGLLTGHTLNAGDDAIVDAYRPFAEEMHAEDCRLFVQLLDGGRERYDGEYAPPPIAPSDVPSERLHSIPRPMEPDEIEAKIEAFADAAVRMEEAGVDGVELGGSHGYLLAQFWSQHTNHRTDEWGGDLQSRCRFTTETVRRIRERVSDDFVVGLRMSAEERHENGLTFEETLPIVEQLEATAPPDYWSIVVGSSSAHRSCSYIVPPATENSRVVREPARRIRETVGEPVIVTSRLATPSRAERALAEGSADVVGMTRALIADPDLPRKVEEGRVEDVTPCVACNQGCIGRYQQHLPIRCTVNPVTGREAEYRDLDPADEPKAVLVVGGGPAGLVAAGTAAERGHDVTLLEASGELGGKVRTYADLDHRGAFDAWIDVLVRRARDAGVEIQLNTAFAAEDLPDYDSDAVVLATGASGRVPDVPIDDGANVLTAVEALEDPDRVEGPNVVISDWDGNWASLDVAATCSERADWNVEVVTDADSAGEAVQQYIRNTLLAQLYEAGVTFTPHARIERVTATEAVVENALSETEQHRVDADTVVFSHGGDASYDLFRALRGGVPVHRVGDCWAPRSLDEAVWEAFETATTL